MGDVQGQGGQPRDPGGSVPPPGYTPPPKQPPQQPAPEQAPVAPTPPTSGSGITFYEDDGKPLKSGSTSLPIGGILIFVGVVALLIFGFTRIDPFGNEKFDQAGYPYTFEYPRGYKKNPNIRLGYASLSIDSSVAITGDRTIVLVGAVSNLPTLPRGVAGNGSVTGVMEHALTDFARQRGFVATGPSRAVEVAGMPGLEMNFTEPYAVSRLVMFGSQTAGYVISCAGPSSPDDFKKACDMIIKTFKLKT